MKKLVIYVHGKGGTAEEAKHYQTLFVESDVIGFDYKSQNPWEAKREFSDFYDLHSKEYNSVILVANSIGAFFSMHALAEKKISKALFISPIANMEKLITNMMIWSNVTEEELCRKKAGEIIRSVRNSKKAPGQDRIYTANEKEYEVWLSRKDSGVPINDAVQAEMSKVRDDLGLTQYIFPWEK